MKIIKTAAFGEQLNLFGDLPTQPKKRKPVKRQPDFSGDIFNDLEYLSDPALNTSVPVVLKHYNVSYRPLNKDKDSTLVAEIQGTPYVIDLDGTCKTAQDWLDCLSEYELSQYVESRDFGKGFWNDPPHVLYHGTDPENWPSIQKQGLKMSCKTRGLGNRNVGCAVFTSPNADACRSYGDTKGHTLIIQINVAQMTQDGYKPNVEMEEGFDEKEAREAIARQLGLDDYYYEMSDNSLYEDTVVIFGNIPPKYLSLYNESEA